MLGWTMGIGVGFFVGCWVLGIRPHWLPREDLDRLLIVVLPAVVVVELMAVFPQTPRWLVWLFRLALVMSNGRVLLHGTSYLTDLTGPGTREWSPSLAWLILGGLAALEGAVWALLSLLAERATRPVIVNKFGGYNRWRGRDRHAFWLCHRRADRAATCRGNHRHHGGRPHSDASITRRRSVGNRGRWSL